MVTRLGIDRPELADVAADPLADGTYRSEASVEVSRAVHQDAVTLARRSLKTSLLGVAVGVGLLFVVTAAESRSLVSLLTFLIASCAVTSASSAFHLVKLQRAVPSDTLRREQHEDSELAAHVLKLAALRPRVSYAVIALVSTVTLVQFATGVEHSVAAAALVKPVVRAGEWWRLLTASLLHGSVAHLVSTMFALLVIGSMIELYDRAARIPLIFVAGAIAGAVASTLMTPTASLGASGGVMALVGYLVVAGGRRPAAPSFLRERALSMMAVTAAYGIAMFFLIDNAGHAGGALAGIGLGLLTIPRRGDTSSETRERWLDGLSWFAAATLVAAALFTIARLVTL